MEGEGQGWKTSAWPYIYRGGVPGLEDISLAHQQVDIVHGWGRARAGRHQPGPINRGGVPGLEDISPAQFFFGYNRCDKFHGLIKFSFL